MLLKKKQIDDIVKADGKNPKEWTDEVVSNAQMEILQGKSEYYKEWKQEVISKAALELLMENQNKKSNQQGHSTDKQTNKGGEMNG